MAAAQGTDAIRNMAEQFYPAALLYLGSRGEAVTALAEALIAAKGESRDAVLQHLLRICGSRTDLSPDLALFPAESPLAAVLKLPAGSRRDLGLHCAGLPDAETAAACGVTEEQFAHRLDKAMRQLTFLGGTAEPAVLTDAVQQLRLPEDELEALCARYTDALAEKQSADDAAETAQAPVVREITRSEAQKGSALRQHVPVWGVVLSVLCMLLAITVTVLLVDRSRLKRHVPTDFEVTDEEPYTVQDLAHLHYITMDEARAIVLEAIGADEADAVFSNTRLDTAKTPVSFKITCIVSEETQYEFTLDAESGAVLRQTTAANALPLSTEGWLPLDEMRSRALAYTKLDAALTVREQLGTDGGKGYYRFQFQDSAGKIYTVQLGATDGILLKYSVDLPAVTDKAGFLPIETAKQRAVSRVGDLTPDQVVFTKEKLDGSVYLLSFTLDDGTQYALELDAKTGMTNTLDVHPVSADTSHAIGLLRARDLALENAGITAADVQQFTKAKIDRSNGAYVYELEFETLAYKYEATLDMESGEILKYKAAYK